MKWIFCAFFLTLLISNLSHARRTSFSEQHSGLVFGVGTYPTSNPEGWDTLSAMAPVGTNVSGQDGSYILPVRAGVFWDYRFLTLDLYYKYISNTKKTWGTTGEIEGSGTSAFKSSGFGSSLQFHILQSDFFRMGIVGQYEFISQKVSHSFNLTGEPTQKITLTNTSSTIGAGIQSAFWLGDLWVLNLNALYNYGTASSWAVARPDLFFNKNWDKGVVLSPKTGQAAEATFSGIFVELALKLNFFSL